MLPRRVHDDLVLAALRERRREAGVTVAARVVILEVAAAGDAGPAQEQVGVERIRFEIDRDRLAGAALNRPGLSVRGVAVEHHIVVSEAALLRLAHVNRVRLAARGAAGTRASRRAPCPRAAGPGDEVLGSEQRLTFRDGDL